jgi:hypothetical protein
MKSYIKIFTLSLTLVLFVVLFPKQVTAQQEDVSFQVFYDQLSPYGQWVDYSNYGYVWIPDVGNDFVPYSTAGHWILTDYGWTWVSDYDWGWAPFHYGRWNFDNTYGWFWVPDNVWGPAWVSWRNADGYYGWEPLESGVSLSMSFGSQYDRQNDHWNFVRNRDIERSDINQYYANQTDRSRIVLNSTMINQTYVDNNRHTTYVSGPSREDAQKAIGTTLKSVVIQENDRPGQTMVNGQLRIFRPQINNSTNRGVKPIPSRIVDIKDVKRPSERIQINQQQNSNPGNNLDQGRQQNNIIPQVNNPRPAVPQNVNPSVPDRNQQPQRTVILRDNNIRPVVQQTANPSIPDRRQQPQRTVNPQNNNPRTTFPQNANPSFPNRRQQLQRTANPQGNNPRPTFRQNTNPSSNGRRQQQQNAVNPRNTYNGPKPTASQNSNPTTNGRSQQPQRTVNPQNNNKKTVPAQNGRPTINKKGVQPKAVYKPQQPVHPLPDKEKKNPQ